MRIVGEVMGPAAEVADEREMLEDVLLRMRENEQSSLPVVRQSYDGKQQLVGLLTLENIGEFMMIRAAQRGRGSPQPLRQAGE